MRGGYEVGVWKARKNERLSMKSNSQFSTGDGKRVKFWKDGG